MTKKEAVAAGLVQLTVWDVPNAKLDTARGRIEYQSWLNDEKERLLAKGRPSEVVDGENHDIALFGKPAENLKPEA